ncbi:hypothetical protein NBRC116590_17120 [Pelagimonas sp. KU-00592-HH]|uniref:HNH endonuclease n=1 Tax=Pelagimonas sp. KU-00592-HH TaxID=3127651 RepID=UPI003102E930
MIASKRDLIVAELEEGTGAEIAVSLDKGGLRSAMRIWFDDLDEKNGPVARIRPHGLKAHRVQLSFGHFSGEIIRQIRKASNEDVQLARALVNSIDPSVKVSFGDQPQEKWLVENGSFQIEATIRHVLSADTDEAVSRTCREVIVPLMAAMAELIGYDVVEEELGTNGPVLEGGLKPTVVNRRERNPRNRLLCIRLHGEKCAACGFEPRERYGIAGGTIEVHHLEPLGNLSTSKPYDPATDLVPLCPNCHRAVHTKRPIPWSLSELQDLMKDTDG